MFSTGSGAIRSEASASSRNRKLPSMLTCSEELAASSSSALRVPTSVL